MKKKAPSIRDVAAKANVSITTVSFILNGKAKERAISDAVVKTVQQVVSELGYSPNPLAQSLRTGSSKLIGLIVEDISNPFFAAIAKLIEDKAYQKGYKIIYSSTENQVEKAKDLIQIFRSRKVDAYIISPVIGMEDDIKLLLQENKPVVLFDRNVGELETHYVGVDHLKASANAAQYFSAQGYEKIAFITTDLAVKQIKDRLTGFRESLSLSKKFDDCLVLTLPYEMSEEHKMRQMQLFFESQKIDAVLFATNYLAVTALKTFQQFFPLSQRPEMIAYDDHVAFSLLNPPISAVEQPLESIAEEIIALVLETLQKKTLAPRQSIFAAKLILRNEQNAQDC